MSSTRMVRHPKPLGTPGRLAIALLSTAAVAAAATATAVVGGPSAGALPRTRADLDLLYSGDAAVLAVAVVRFAAVALALWWLGLIVASWLAAWRGRHDRVGVYARLLPAPLRMAVTLSLSPMLVALPATVAGAQNQPPTGVPSSIAGPADDPTSPTAPSTRVLELNPLPDGPQPRPGAGGSPTAGTTPAPGLPVDGRIDATADGDPAPGVATIGQAPSGDQASCPTIVTRGDVHWFDQARAHLDAQLGRPSSEQEAEIYWYRCVAHNVERLPEPDEPDIVPPGQVLELPELPRTT
mgnify:FL=1